MALLAGEAYWQRPWSAIDSVINHIFLKGLLYIVVKLDIQTYTQAYLRSNVGLRQVESQPAR